MVAEEKASHEKGGYYWDFIDRDKFNRNPTKARIEDNVKMIRRLCMDVLREDC